MNLAIKDVAMYQVELILQNGERMMVKVEVELWKFLIGLLENLIIDSFTRSQEIGNLFWVSSSVVEQLALNQLAAGSIPA